MSLLGLAACALPALADEQPGLTSTEVLRSVGIVAAVVAIGGLLLVQLFFRGQMARASYRWALLVFLLVLPAVALLGATETVFEQTKTVESCGSCHVMEPFIADMQAPRSPTLAAQHFRNKWIPDQQCYACHTTYGVHGTLAAKRDGFRHWLLYVTETWDEPIQYSGSYPNVSCYECHGETAGFEAVQAHTALRADLAADRVSCAACHGPTHPTPPERRIATLPAHE